MMATTSLTRSTCLRHLCKPSQCWQTRAFSGLINLSSTHAYSSRRTFATTPRMSSSASPATRDTIPSTLPPLSSPPPTNTGTRSVLAKLVASPSPETIAEQEIDEEMLVPLGDVRLMITDRAAERLQQISILRTGQNPALRIGVESGGCHGYQYKLELSEKGASTDDYLFSHPSIQKAEVVIDSITLGMMNGSTLDFATELIGSSFRVVGNPMSKGSGCGCGVSWELKE